MKRLTTILMVMLLVLSLCACGQKAPTWQEQYDLGIKYFSEGNYEEAIIAFTAAIEIDPNRAEAYIGRGGAYLSLGETDENLAAAQADYEQAISLDEAIAGAYLGLADVYIYSRNYDGAMSVLKDGLSLPMISDEEFARMSELIAMIDNMSNFEKMESFHTTDELNKTQLNIAQITASIAKNGGEWREFRSLLESTTNTGGDEFYTEIEDYKIHYFDDEYGGTLEIRPENGTAYYFSMYQDNYVAGNVTSWNWNGEFKTYLDMIPYLDDSITEYYDVYGVCISTAKNGVIDGDWYDALVHDATGQIFDKHLSRKFVNGNEVYYYGQYREPELEQGWNSPKYFSTRHYADYETFRKYELWD